MLWLLAIVAAPAKRAYPPNPQEFVLLHRHGALGNATAFGTVLVVGASGGGELKFFGQRGYHVLGVECLPREYHRLHAAFVANPCITMVGGCAAEGVGLRTLHLAGDSSSFTEKFAKPPHNPNAMEWAKARQEQVSAMTVLTLPLDPIVESRGDHISFVWIDTQGAEYGVFRGLQRTLAEHRPTVVYEFYMDRSHRSRALLQDLGYACDQISDGDMMCTPRAEDARDARARWEKNPSRPAQCKWPAIRSELPKPSTNPISRAGHATHTLAHAPTRLSPVAGPATPHRATSRPRFPWSRST